MSVSAVLINENESATEGNVMFVLSRKRSRQNIGFFIFHMEIYATLSLFHTLIFYLFLILGIKKTHKLA